MAEVPISNLIQLTTPNDGDVYPVVSIANITQKIAYSTLYNDISSKVVVGKYTPITTFNDSQTFLSNASGNWQTAYTTVTANSAAWSAGGSATGLTIFKELSSTTTPNAGTNVYALSVNSLSANVDVALIAKGTGATLAQIPDNTATGGAKRGQYATDWQKIRTQSTQVASGLYSVIGGGANNTASGNYSLVVSGSGNISSGGGSVIGGGVSNISSNTQSTIGGGLSGTASGDYSTIGGGIQNIASAGSSTVGGGAGNTASNTYSTIAGGATNLASGSFSTIGGGNELSATGNYSTNIGGYQNHTSGYGSTIAGGRINSALSSYAVIGGGYQNTVGSEYSFIAAGQSNTTTLSNTFILGSNITAVSANYTYVNNITSQGTVAANNFKYSTSTATFTAGPITIDAAQAQLHHITYNGATTSVDLHMSNIYGVPGRDVKIHVVNRSGGTRTVTPKYISTSPALTGTIPLTTTGLAASGASTAMLTNAIATIWVANIGGNIVGSFG